MNANMPLKEFWFCFFLFREKEARGLMKTEMELRMFFSFRLQKPEHLKNWWQNLLVEQALKTEERRSKTYGVGILRSWGNEI